MSGSHKAWKAALFSRFPFSQFGDVHSQRCSSCPLRTCVDRSLDVISHSEGWLCGDWPPVPIRHRLCETHPPPTVHLTVGHPSCFQSGACPITRSHPDSISGTCFLRIGIWPVPHPEVGPAYLLHGHAVGRAARHACDTKSWQV